MAGTLHDDSASMTLTAIRSPSWIQQALAGLLDRRELTDAEIGGAVAELMAGHGGDAEAAALLMGLRMKGETASELAAAASVLRRHMVRLDTGRDDVLDTCGTGGDGTGTFNISTAAALVAAAAGVPVVKHGNRAFSSCSGSGDVLTSLGVSINPDPEFARRCLNETGLAFCFAPHFHPALSRLASVRRQLRIRTIFNCLGPLANPAGAAFQLLGVGQGTLLDPLAGALAKLGTRHSLVVCGDDGLDEVTLGGTTHVRDVRGQSVRSLSWTAADFDLAPCSLDDVRVSGAEESADVIRRVLRGQSGPASRIVLANAAAALLAADRVQTVTEGVALAAEAIHAGRAAAVLDKLAACSQQAARVSR
jgi:anthranilate phosphoribosyltransferase